MQDVMAKAELLGRAVANSDRFKALREAEAAIEADEEVKNFSMQLEEHAEKIRKLEESNSPIEPEDKRKFAELQEKVRSCEKLQNLARAQADYAEMMAKVNQRIQERLAPKGDGK